MSVTSPSFDSVTLPDFCGCCGGTCYSAAQIASLPDALTMGYTVPAGGPCASVPVLLTLTRTAPGDLTWRSTDTPTRNQLGTACTETIYYTLTFPPTGDDSYCPILIAHYSQLDVDPNCGGGVYPCWQNCNLLGFVGDPVSPPPSLSVEFLMPKCMYVKGSDPFDYPANYFSAVIHQ